MRGQPRRPSHSFPPAPASGHQTGRRRERAFLVGMEYRSASRVAAPAADTAHRAQARQAAQQREENNAKLRDADGAGSRDRERDLPGFTAEESLAELRELATSAGAEVVGEFLQKRDRPDPATLIGRGKLEELKGAAASADADVILFDHDLSPSQQRNIENEAGVRVIGRTQLILDIFARHARTREGQLQVELAQLEYLLPRLAGRGKEMSQLGGGIGTRGPGETQLETDRRKIARRMRHISEQVEQVRRTRAQQRQRRESAPVGTVALVGYTNAGKSTLFNALTKADVLSSSRMFATLDPTLRSVTLPSKRKVLLSDTVGFIRNLPHALVQAFRATLEEVQRAELVIHVSDVASASRAEQEQQVEKVLRELEADAKPRLLVLNKIDLLSPAELEKARRPESAEAVEVSALKGTGLGTLLERVDELLTHDPVARAWLRVPQAEGKALSLVEARARILKREYRDGVVELDVQAPESLLRRVKQWTVNRG